VNNRFFSSREMQDLKQTALLHCLLLKKMPAYYKKIIVVDENVGIRLELVIILKQICENKKVFYNLEGFADGKSLVARILRGNCDLVFTDSQVLELSSLEAIAQIRQAGNKTPIYVFSGSSSAIEAEKAGATGYISKTKSYDKYHGKIEAAVIKHLLSPAS